MPDICGSAMMVDLYKSFNMPLSHETLYEWHSSLMNGRRDLRTIGVYRTDADPMQFVSGAIHYPIVHFEAPPSYPMAEEMETFIRFFEESREGGKQAMTLLARPESLTCILYPFTPSRMATDASGARLPGNPSPKVSDTRR